MQRFMDTLAPVIETFVKRNTSVQRLHKACGDSPPKQPPAESVIAEVRAQVGLALGLSPGDCELHAPSARWMYMGYPTPSWTKVWIPTKQWVHGPNTVHPWALWNISNMAGSFPKMIRQRSLQNMC